MKTKSLLLFLFLGIITLSGCSKDENEKVKNEETLVGTWWNYRFQEVVEKEGEDSELLKDLTDSEKLNIIIFHNDGTAIVRNYDEETEEWEEIAHNYEAKDGIIKIVEQGVDENEPGYHVNGTYEFANGELILKQTVVDEYQGVTTSFYYTNWCKRID